jgi:hypothetical protein
VEGSYNGDRKELLINFGVTPFKEGCQRLVNGPQFFASSCEPGLMNKSLVNAVMKDVGDVAELKRLFLEDEQEDA